MIYNAFLSEQNIWDFFHLKDDMCRRNIFRFESIMLSLLFLTDKGTIVKLIFLFYFNFKTLGRPFLHWNTFRIK